MFPWDGRSCCCGPFCHRTDASSPTTPSRCVVICWRESEPLALVSSRVAQSALTALVRLFGAMECVTSYRAQRVASNVLYLCTVLRSRSTHGSRTCGSRATFVFESLSPYYAATDSDQTPFSCLSLLLQGLIVFPLLLGPAARRACCHLFRSTAVVGAAHLGSDALWQLFASPHDAGSLRAAAR